MVEWSNSWLAEQGVQSSNPSLATLISEIGYLLLSSQNMTERLLKGRRSVCLSTIHTTSAIPPGRMVLTTTPVLRPPMIPNPSPEPSFTRSITSI